MQAQLAAYTQPKSYDSSSRGKIEMMRARRAKTSAAITENDSRPQQQMTSEAMTNPDEHIPLNETMDDSLILHAPEYSVGEWEDHGEEEEELAQGDEQDENASVAEESSRLGEDQDVNDDKDLNAKSLAEFKKVLDAVHEYIPGLTRRFDNTGKIVTNSEMVGDRKKAKPIAAFPETTLIPQAFGRIHSILLGRHDPKTEIDLSRPGQLPSGAKSTADFNSKSIPMYKKSNYSYSTDRFTPEVAVTDSHFDDHTGVNPKTGSIPVKTVEDIEVQCRKALLAISAADLTLGTMRRMNKKDHLTEEELVQRDKVCASMVTALTHTTTFMSNAVANCELARRKLYLDKCSEDQVPRGAKEWLMLQPILAPNRTDKGLFGSTLEKLKTFTLENKRLRSTFLVGPTVPGYSRPKGQRRPQRGANRGGRNQSHGQNQTRIDSNFRGNPRHMSRRGHRGDRGRRGGNSGPRRGFAPPPPQHP
jgi:hypothetical protein